MTIISNLMPDDELDVPKLDFSLAKFTRKKEKKKNTGKLSTGCTVDSTRICLFLLFHLVLIISTTVLEELRPNYLAINKTWAY